MKFNNIPGLAETKDHLMSTVVANKVAHAQLFAGVKGAPVLPMAIAYINYLLCENKAEDGACGVCPPCTKTLKHVHPDIQYIFPTAAIPGLTRKDALSHKFLKDWRVFLEEQPYGSLEDWTKAFGAEDKLAIIPIDESREIIKNLTLKPFEAEYKIVVIWLPEKMQGPAASALLKVLEEPPGKSLFVLVSEDDDNLLTTIKSRTQKLVIRKFTDSELQSYLEDHHQLDKQKASRVAYLSDGSIHEAMQVIKDADHDTHDWFREWMRACFTAGLPGMVNMADQFGGMNKSLRKSVLYYGLSMMRETAISQSAPELSRSQGEDLKFATNFSKVMDIPKVEQIVSMLNESLYHLDRNANPKIEFLNLSLEISQTLKN